MRRAIVKAVCVAAFIAALVVAIGRSASDNPWLGVWFILFIFVGVPLALLSIRDLLVSIRSNASESSRAWLLLHVCAVFAAGVGLLLARMSKASGGSKSELDQWLVLVLPGLVYLAPVLLALRTGNPVFLSALLRAFRRRS